MLCLTGLGISCAAVLMTAAAPFPSVSALVDWPVSPTLTISRRVVCLWWEESIWLLLRLVMGWEWLSDSLQKLLRLLLLLPGILTSLKLSPCYHPKQPCRHHYLLCEKKGGMDRAPGTKGWPSSSARLLLRCFPNTEVLDLVGVGS